MKRHEVKFFGVLAAIFAVLALLCLTWQPIYFGTVFFGLLAIGFTGEAIMLSLKQRFYACKVICMTGKAIFILFLISFMLVEGIIISGERTDNEVYSAQRVLVLGAKIYGNKPSYSLQNRLDAAIQLLEKNQDAVLVVCGGQGTDEIMPEAHVMKQYLIDNGVSEDKILVEDTSTNTIENIENAKQLYNLENYKTAVITNEFHLARARKLMKRAGLDSYGMSAPTPYTSLRIISHLREYCSTLGLILTNRYF